MVVPVHRGQHLGRLGGRRVLAEVGLPVRRPHVCRVGDGRPQGKAGHVHATIAAPRRLDRYRSRRVCIQRGARRPRRVVRCGARCQVLLELALVVWGSWLYDWAGEDGRAMGRRWIRVVGEVLDGRAAVAAEAHLQVQALQQGGRGCDDCPGGRRPDPTLPERLDTWLVRVVAPVGLGGASSPRPGPHCESGRVSAIPHLAVGGGLGSCTS